MRNGDGKTAVRSLGEAEYWALVRAVEGLGGGGPLLDVGWTPLDHGFASYRAARDAAMIGLLGESGLRADEACGLAWQDVSAGGGISREVAVRAEVAKGGFARTVPASVLLRGQLVRLSWFVRRGATEGEGCMVLSSKPRGPRMSVRRVEQIVRALGARVLGRRVWPHQLRHTFAARLRRRVDLAVVQQLLGHRHLSSTQRYVNVEPGELVSAVESLGRDV